MYTKSTQRKTVMDNEAYIQIYSARRVKPRKLHDSFDNAIEVLNHACQISQNYAVRDGHSISSHKHQNLSSVTDQRLHTNRCLARSLFLYSSLISRIVEYRMCEKDPKNEESNIGKWILHSATLPSVSSRQLIFYENIVLSSLSIKKSSLFLQGGCTLTASFSTPLYQFSQDSTLLDQKEINESESFPSDNLKPNKVTTEYSFTKLRSTIISAANIVLSPGMIPADNTHEPLNKLYRSQLKLFIGDGSLWRMMGKCSQPFDDKFEAMVDESVYPGDETANLEWDSSCDMKHEKNVALQSHIVKENQELHYNSITDIRHEYCYSKSQRITSTSDDFIKTTDTSSGRSKVRFKNQIEEIPRVIHHLHSNSFFGTLSSNNQNSVTNISDQDSNLCTRLSDFGHYLKNRAKDAIVSDFEEGFTKIHKNQNNQMIAEYDYYYNNESQDSAGALDKEFTSPNPTAKTNISTDENYKRRTITVVRVGNYFTNLSESTGFDVPTNSTPNTYFDISDFPSLDFIASYIESQIGPSIEIPSFSQMFSDSETSATISREINISDPIKKIISHQYPHKCKSKMTKCIGAPFNQKHLKSSTTQYETDVPLIALLSDGEPTCRALKSSSHRGFCEYYSTVSSVVPWSLRAKRLETKLESSNQKLKSQSTKAQISSYKNTIHSLLETLVKNMQQQKSSNAAVAYKIARAKEIVKKVQTISSRSSRRRHLFNEHLSQIFDCPDFLDRRTGTSKTNLCKKKAIYFGLVPKKETRRMALQNGQLDDEIIKLMTSNLSVKDFFREICVLIYDQSNEELGRNYELNEEHQIRASLELLGVL